MFIRACLWLICNYRLPLVSPFRNRPFSISTLRHRVPSRSSLKFSNDSTLLTYRPPSVSPPRNHLPSRSRLKFRAFFNHRPSSVSPPRIRLPSRSPLLFSNDSNLFNHLPHPILSVPRRFISDHHLSLLVDCDLTRYNYDRKNDQNIIIDNR